MKTLKVLQEEAENLKHKHFYVVECPKCHEKFVAEFGDFEHIMFEPIEKEEEYYSAEDGNWEKHTRMVTVSSDYSKDIYKVAINCNCGQEELVLTSAEFKSLRTVNWDGTNNFSFSLSETETEKARAFMNKHRETCSKKQNLTLSEYFSFHIMPTGLGNATSIECNLCGESENITDYDQW